VQVNQLIETITEKSEVANQKQTEAQATKKILAKEQVIIDQKTVIVE